MFAGFISIARAAFAPFFSFAKPFDTSRRNSRSFFELRHFKIMRMRYLLFTFATDGGAGPGEDALGLIKTNSYRR